MTYNVCPVCNSPLDKSDKFCSMCGFRLSENTEEFQPVSIENTGTIPSTGHSNEATLTVKRGINLGSKYKISSDICTLGRNPNCTIFLNDMTVSRHHATIKHENGAYIIADNKSFNGLWVNNKPAEIKTLKSGDIIQLGAFCLKFEC